MRRSGDDWRAIFSADVSGDQGEVDFQYEAIWRPDENRRLRLALIQVDRRYNNKGNSDNKYERTPVTLFAHYRQRLASGLTADLAVNYFLHTQYEDRDNGLYIRGDQLRFDAEIGVDMVPSWRSELAFQLEDTGREFRALIPGSNAGQQSFSRRLRSVSQSEGSPSRVKLVGAHIDHW